ncbi:MAG: dihydropteroate synthase [Gammaproteobacteria bacterium]|nr:dihydropteroate synthase [Gammaproteobacteria bacterium]
MIINLKHGVLDLNQPQVMGILNVTPDSFSDGGKFNAVDTALFQARQMEADGAAIIDIGGESTRPGAEPVNIEQELDRVIPVITAIRNESDIPISIDTSKPEVMLQAVQAGADMVNDVCALQLEGAPDVVAELDVPVCLMHMLGEPRTMQASPQYNDLIEDIKMFFKQRIDQCLAAGIKQERILLDPGFGFGKTPEHNLSLIKHFREYLSFELPLLAGVSRKSTIGYILNKEVDERLYGSIALATIATMNGASIIRAHDVAATVDAIKMCQAVNLAP